MIELSEDLKNAVQAHPEEPVRLIDPATRQEFVLLRAEEYDRLNDDDYDASPWTDEELTWLAAENANLLGWEGMDVYQDM